MKVSIILTDIPTPADPKEVAINFEFDPPIADFSNEVPTPASELAGCAVMSIEHYADKLHLSTTIAAAAFPVPEVLDSCEINTILAALRFYQRSGDPCLRMEDIHAISVGDRGDGHGARDISMDFGGINLLCKKLSAGRDSRGG